MSLTKPPPALACPEILVLVMCAKTLRHPTIAGVYTDRGLALRHYDETLHSDLDVTTLEIQSRTANHPHEPMSILKWHVRTPGEACPCTSCTAERKGEPVPTAPAHTGLGKPKRDEKPGLLAAIDHAEGRKEPEETVAAMAEYATPDSEEIAEAMGVDTADVDDARAHDFLDLHAPEIDDEDAEEVMLGRIAGTEPDNADNPETGWNEEDADAELVEHTEEHTEERELVAAGSFSSSVDEYDEYEGCE